MQLQIKKHIEVVDKGNMFAIETESETSYLKYHIYKDTIELYSAYVPEVLRGNGHAASLILFAMQFAVLNGYWVVPACPAVREYIRQFPEWIYIVKHL